MFCSSAYGSKRRSKDYLPGQYHYNALCRGQYHYNVLVEREYEICSPLVSFDLECESVTCNSCNTGTSGLPDMYTPSPWGRTCGHNIPKPSPRHHIKPDHAPAIAKYPP